MELKLNLPDKLAEEAKAKGLLEPPAIEKLLRGELRRCRVEKLFDDAGRLAATNAPALTESELEAEIQAARAERRQGHARGR